MIDYKEKKPRLWDMAVNNMVSRYCDTPPPYPLLPNPHPPFF